MDKKYQIFISSTYKDLIEVRREVSRLVLQLTEIPAAMEDFGSIDKEALVHIKEVIDRCDYYVLIIAGRYGSCDDSGVGYTEQEYDYAEASGKTILVFIRRDMGKIPSEFVESDPDLRHKLDLFRAKVAQPTKRLVTFWDDPRELQSSVVVALSNAFRTHPGVGWVRANSIMFDAEKSKAALEQRDKEISHRQVEVRRLEYENDRLRREIELARSEAEVEAFDFDDLMELHSMVIKWPMDEHFMSKLLSLTWLEIFKIFAPLVKRHVYIARVRQQLTVLILAQIPEAWSINEPTYVDNDMCLDIETFFMGQLLMEVKNDNQIYMTDKGRKLLQSLKNGRGDT